MAKIKKFLVANVDMLFCFLLLGLIFAVCLNPSPYISATYKGFCVWAKIVLPSLFMFFILTKLLMQMNGSFKVFGLLDKPFRKMYGVSRFGGYVFLMSILSGYPIGTKLTSEFYEQGLITRDEAHRMLSFTSTSGPMFVVGSVAIKMFNNVKLGIVVFICHILSALINGFLYKNIKVSDANKTPPLTHKTATKQTLNDIMLNSIISLLMVGGYIALCFCLLEGLLHNQIGNAVSSILTQTFGVDFLSPIIGGIVEVTNGCVALSGVSGNLRAICVILTCLTSFGGLSIHLQSQMFASKCGIKYSYFLKTKTTQTMISLVLSLIACFIFF